MHRLGPIEVADYHVAGAPFRVVASGIPQLEGNDALERIGHARANGDEVRWLVVNEPRGHPAIQGGYVTLSDNPEADLGLVFFHQDGYSMVSGSGTIALITWAIESGTLRVAGRRPRLVAETPAGLVKAVAAVEDGRVESVWFTNVTSYVAGRFIPVQLSDGVVSVDIAYGGAYFATIDAGELGLTVTTDNLQKFVQLGEEIAAILGDNPSVVHPTDHRLSGLAGTVFYEDLDGSGPGRHQRSVTVAAGGGIHRSPCGGATSARLALLDSSAVLARDQSLVHESIFGGRFTGRVVGDSKVGGVHGVLPELEGRAYRTGAGTLWLEADDPIGYGYQVH